MLPFYAPMYVLVPKLSGCLEPALFCSAPVRKEGRLVNSVELQSPQGYFCCVKGYFFFSLLLGRIGAKRRQTTQTWRKKVICKRETGSQKSKIRFSKGTNWVMVMSSPSAKPNQSLCFTSAPPFQWRSEWVFHRSDVSLTIDVSYPLRKRIELERIREATTQPHCTLTVTPQWHETL